MRKFRFGVNQTGGSDGMAYRDFARKVEDLGFSTLIMQDHLMQQFAPLPALVAAGAATTRLRLGTIVLDNDFRHPALLAKEAATVDVLVGGRLELGVGAGWMQRDYDMTGLVFGQPAERFERLRETVAIIKAFFNEERTVDFHGKYYNITGLDAFPRSPQGRPPIMIGGRQKRMISYAAREADIVSISMLDRRAPDMPKPPSFAEKIGWVKAAAGDRFSTIEVHANTNNVQVTDNARAAIDATAERLRIPAEDVLQSPANLIGSADAIVDQLQAWRETCGLSYFVVPASQMENIAPIVARLAGS